MNITIYKVVTAHGHDEYFSNLTDATQRAYDLVEKYLCDAYVDRFEMSGSWHLKVTQEWITADKEKKDEEN